MPPGAGARLWWGKTRGPMQDEQANEPHPHGERFTFDRRLIQLRRRLFREASFAVGMLEEALDALWRLDVAAAREVRKRDERVDREEVQIEQECYELLALQHAFARDFRVVTFILKVNADIERVADHASSIAKIAIKVRENAEGFGDGGRFGTPTIEWPTSLTELGQRVPIMCHELMRAVLDEDVVAARALVRSDETIDQLDRRLFDEVVDLVRAEPLDVENGLLIYRLGRELERVADLMTNIAENLVYMATGEIVRHTKHTSRGLRGGSGGGGGAEGRANQPDSPTSF